jgi:hypothetical protein
MHSPPFELLEYDPELYHGQIWLKYRVYSDLAALRPEERQRQRYVFYLPLSEDRLDTPDDNGMHHLELLTEYRVTGVLWRLGSKRPTLFSFLRHAGGTLADNPSEQRRLYDGGRNSLLAKYAAKFVDQPAAFWNTLLTPEVVQSRLIGDVEQTILDLGIAPETTWQALQDKGLADGLLTWYASAMASRRPWKSRRCECVPSSKSWHSPRHTWGMASPLISPLQIACHRWCCASTTCSSCSAGCGTLRVDQPGIAGSRR